VNPFVVISRYFWALAIVVTFVNLASWKRRSKTYTEGKPDLAEGYENLFRSAAVWLNVPWVVMGVGISFGHVTSVWNYFRAQDGNPYVLSWFGSVFLLWIASVYWVFFQDGAATLVKYPGLLNYNFSSATQVKLFLILCLAGGIFGVLMMFTTDIPVPNVP
jgi:hypothetical protein